MNWRRISIRVTEAATAMTILIACSAIWLSLTAPASVARALDERTLSPIVRELAAALAQVVSTLIAYL